MSTNQNIENFFNEIKKSGLTPEAFCPIVDGNIHRFRDTKLDKSGQLNGWYVLYDGGSFIAGAFGNWKSGLKETFSSWQGKIMSPDDKAAYRSKLEAIKARVEQEHVRMHAECRQRADELWNTALPAKPEHPYLLKKYVAAYGIKQNGDLLLIPVRDATGTLHGLQKIGPNGEKRFMSGMAVSGFYHAIGKPDGIILIAEGYATGATLHQATGYAVAVAFNAGNLKPVAGALRAKYSDATFIVCADDDHTTDGNPGISKATEAARAVNGLLAVPSFPASRKANDTDFNDLARLAGSEAVKQCIAAATQPEKIQADDNQKVNNTNTLWDVAKEFFPTVEFPWEVFPSSLAESLKQLARSHATSATALPGAAKAIFSSVLGRTIEVSPKASWCEPLIFWFGDIRPSGQGKTPAAQALCPVLYAAQDRADDEYKAQYETWSALPKKGKGPPPARARGYFITDLTLEGLRNDLSGHGGTICILDELSTFINSQNQYRGGKGGDREAWLKLFDGKPARIARVEKSLTIRGSRVNLFGGIQPRVWREVFGGDKSLYIEDGTIYRFLPVFEGEQFHLLTDETWNAENKNIWERILSNAMSWADFRAQQNDWEPLCLMFDEDAQRYFIDWINQVFSCQNNMPEQLRGFFPKLKTYVVRLTGLLHCMTVFDAGVAPDGYLSKQDVEKGIKCALFYMGHIVEALRHLLNLTATAPVKVTEQGQQIADALRALAAQQDNGRLAIGFITDQFNKLHPARPMTPKSMGAMLRALGLTVTDSRHNANGKQGVHCLEWDAKSDELIKQSPDVQEVQRSSNNGAEIPLDFETASPEVQQPCKCEYPFAGLPEHCNGMSSTAIPL